MSRRSRDKGARSERAIARLLQAQSFAATKISRAYQAGHDRELLLGDDRMLRIECKARANGFRELYSWLNERDILILKADRREPLVVVRLSLAADIARAGAAQMWA
jgi:Holliday junction resolvase